MMRVRFIFLLLIICLLVSCDENEKPFEVKKENISLILPPYVKEDELAEDAIIEYANRYRNFYVVVHRLKDTINQDSLWRQTTTRITQSLKSSEIDTTKSTGTFLTTIKGHFEGEKEPIIYRQKLLYQSGNSYLLTVWTRGNERYKKHQPTIDEILLSFKTVK